MQRYRINYDKVGGGELCAKEEEKEIAGTFEITSRNYKYHINGDKKDNKTITIEAGKCYKFIINVESIHPVYFTHDDTGAGAGYDPNLIKGFDTATQGTFYLKFSKKDNPLYYQCMKHSGMGGQIVID